MPEGIADTGPRGVISLGMMAYPEALALQQDALARRLSNPELPDQVFFVTHPPVFTLGRRGGAENLKVSKDFLEGKGIGVIQTDRGGNITFHGPGQAVLYPVVNLNRARISVPDFVSGLEEIMKQTCQDFGVLADRDHRNHGLWVGNAKIGSVGISLKKGISIHGLALNVNPDLTPFSWINPCGLNNLAMTSIAREIGLAEQRLGQAPGPGDLALMERVGQLFARLFNTIF